MAIVMPFKLLLIHMTLAIQSKHAQPSVGKVFDGDAKMTSCAQRESMQTRFRRQWNWSILVERFSSRNVVRDKVARWKNLMPSFPWIAPGGRA